MGLSFKNIRQMSIRLAEAGVAFVLVFLISMIWSKTSKNLSTDVRPDGELSKTFETDGNLSSATSKAVDPGLMFDATRKDAFVRVEKAKIFSTPLELNNGFDEVVFGRKVRIEGWDDSKKFVQIITSDAVKGYMNVNDLSYDLDDNLDLDEASKISSIKREIFAKYLGDVNTADVFGRDFDYRVSMRPAHTSKSLSEFQRQVNQLTSKRGVDVKFEKIGFAIFVHDDKNQQKMIYPEPRVFLSQVRKVADNIGVFLTDDVKEDAGGGSSSEDIGSFKMKFSRDFTAVSPKEEGTRDLILRDLRLDCLGSACRLLLEFPDGKNPEGLTFILFGDLRGLKPAVKFSRTGEQDQPSGIVYLDIDGDGGMDLAIYTNAADSVIREVSKLYMARQQDKAWQVFFISELKDVSGDQIVIDPEPGEYKAPLVAVLSSRNSSPIAYTLTGADPVCPSGPDVRDVSLVDLFIDKTSVIKAKICAANGNGDSSQHSSTFKIDL